MLRRTMNTLKNVVAVVAAIALLGSGCDLINSVRAKSVLVATVLATPALEVKPNAIAGFDASLPDAGVSFDAGALADAGINIPPQTVVNAYFGQRQSESLDTPPSPVTGATITLSDGTNTWPLAELGAGNYGLLGADGGITYISNATYVFTVNHAGVTYQAQVERAPAQERSPELHTSAGYIELNAGQGTTITREATGSASTRNLAFVTVLPINRDGQRGDPTWTNVPKDPVGFLKLVLLPDEWKADAIAIPGTAFPDANKNYVIVMQAAKLGGPVGDTLFTGSPVIAGTADVGVVKTRP